MLLSHDNSVCTVTWLLYDVCCCQQDLVNRGVCTEAEATELVNKKLMPLVGEQQRKFEKMLESFDVS